MLESSLAELAQDVDCGGRIHFVVADSNDSGLSQLHGFKREPAIYVVEPGKFGIDGQVVHHFALDIAKEDLRRQLVAYANAKLPLTKQHRPHVRAGRQEGIDWKTEIPVTDRMSLQAQQRGE
jgi:hypothetical protein